MVQRQGMRSDPLPLLPPRSMAAWGVAVHAPARHGQNTCRLYPVGRGEGDLTSYAASASCAALRCAAGPGLQGLCAGRALPESSWRARAGHRRTPARMPRASSLIPAAPPCGRPLPAVSAAMPGASHPRPARPPTGPASVPQGLLPRYAAGFSGAQDSCPTRRAPSGCARAP